MSTKITYNEDGSVTKEVSFPEQLLYQEMQDLLNRNISFAVQQKDGHTQILIPGALDYIRVNDGQRVVISISAAQPKQTLAMAKLTREA